MQYSYHRWVLRFFSLVSIGSTAFLKFREAVDLYKENLLFFIPLAIAVPAVMTGLMLGLKIPDLGTAGEQPTSPYAALRGDFIKFAVLTTAAMGLFILQN